VTAMPALASYHRLRSSAHCCRASAYITCMLPYHTPTSGLTLLMRLAPLPKSLTSRHACGGFTAQTIPHTWPWWWPACVEEPRKTCDAPPGGASTRLLGRSDRKLPTCSALYSNRSGGQNNRVYHCVVVLA